MVCPKCGAEANRKSRRNTFVRARLRRLGFRYYRCLECKRAFREWNRGEFAKTVARNSRLVSLIASLLIGFAAISILALAASILIDEPSGDRTKPTTPIKKGNPTAEPRPGE